MYYNVLVASQRYHKAEPLTYSCADKLSVGTIVEVRLQHEKVLGVVSGLAGKPAFATKPIIRSLPCSLTPPQLLLMTWLKAYYPAPAGLIHGLFVPSFIRSDVVASTDVVPNHQAVNEPPLTTEQQAALTAIRASSARSVLVHGDTGSGKTRLYSELAKETLNSGRSVLILTPEIGLTAQLVRTFSALFPQVVVLHSDMTPKRRREVWTRIALSHDPVVVIGPRSALFAPVRSLGLIVIDELQDSAYKQEQAPYYLASRVAAKLTELTDARLILGSATPPVSDYYIFKKQALPIVRLTQNATGQSRNVQSIIVDLKDRSYFSRSAQLSDQLLKSIDAALGNHQQVLLFLNRRGTARIIACQVCGWQALCPNCDLPLTYHGDSHRAICHTCGYSTGAPTSCQQCGATDIIFRSAGTKSIVGELERLFPKAVIQRFDSDSAKSDRLAEQYDTVAAGKVDILVGTQMVGKGLDLPKLAVVGVILADTALNFPDYTAQERTYQMLNQVIGRVGRGHVDGQVVIQTHNPGALVIKQALESNYDTFYRDQLQERKRYGFPPFCYLLKLTCKRKTASGAQAAAEKLYDALSRLKLPLEIIGPAPAFVTKSGGHYHWQLVIKAKRRSTLLAVIDQLPSQWFYDLDPLQLL